MSICSYPTYLPAYLLHRTQAFSLEALRESEVVPEALRCPICRKLMDEAVLVLACDKVYLGPFSLAISALPLTHQPIPPLLSISFPHRRVAIGVCGGCW